MTIIERIDKDTIEALKAGDKFKTTVLRGLKSDIKYAILDHPDSFGDPETIKVLSSCAKKRRDSIEQFTNGNRPDLAEKEQKELAIIEAYLPAQLSEDKLREIVSAAITEVGATTPKDMGKIMKVVMPKVQGQADGKQVNKLVMEILAN